MGRESRQARRARQRREQEQRQRGRAPASRNQMWSLGIVGVIVALVIAVVAIQVMTNQGSAQSKVFADATATAQAQYTPVPGLAAGPARCSYNEMVAQGFYHVHAHLTLLHNGQNVTVPADIGYEINNDCLYWVHTHQPSHGIIHIESPYKIVPTLGDFFKIWGTTINSHQVYKFSGPLKVYVNQKPYTGDPANIKLFAHTDVTVEVGGPFSPPKRFPFAKYQV